MNIGWLVIALAAATACSPLVPATPIASPDNSPSSPAAPPTAGPSVDGVQPAPAHLVVRSWTCLMCIYETGTMVFDDGLVLHAPEGVHSARRLTAGGVDWVRARLAESPLAAGPRSYVPVPVPGASPLQRDHTPRRFELEVEGQRVLFSSDVLAEYADEPAAWQIPDEMRALDALAIAMEDPDGWVPEAMWATGWAPYRADRFLLFVQPSRDEPTGEPTSGMPDADTVPWPFFGRIDEVGTTRPGGDPLGERCLVATPADIERLAAAEARAGVIRSMDEPYVSIVYPWRRGKGTMLVATRWLLPHEPSTCNLPDSGDW